MTNNCNSIIYINDVWSVYPWCTVAACHGWCQYTGWLPRHDWAALVLPARQIQYTCCFGLFSPFPFIVVVFFCYALCHVVWHCLKIKSKWRCWILEKYFTLLLSIWSPLDQIPGILTLHEMWLMYINWTLPFTHHQHQFFLSSFLLFPENQSDPETRIAKETWKWCARPVSDVWQGHDSVYS